MKAEKFDAAFEDFLEENKIAISILKKIGVFSLKGSSWELDQTLLPDGPEAPEDEYKEELENALNLLIESVFDDDNNEPSFISAGEIDKIESYLLELIGSDSFYLKEALDADSYELETDWARGECLIGPETKGERPVIHL